MDEDEIIIYKTSKSGVRIGLTVFEGTIWLPQLTIATLLGTTKQNVSLHIIKIMKKRQFDKDFVVKGCLVTTPSGRNYRTKVYSLEVILAIGEHMRSPEAERFLRWAERNLTQYLRQ
jgi:Virulence protein